MYYYQRLRDLREDKDKTQVEIAEILSTSQKQYSRWETGAREIPAHNIVILAEYYNVSTDYILGVAKNKSSNDNGAKNVNFNQNGKHNNVSINL